jgi:hypothetical protein
LPHLPSAFEIWGRRHETGAAALAFSTI